MEKKHYSRFTTELKVRPDDIDMFNHVHNSIYFDYVLAARYEQMHQHYGMAMEDFLQQGYGWVVKTAYIDYKRPLTLGDSFLVTTFGLIQPSFERHQHDMRAGRFPSPPQDPPAMRHQSPIP